MPQVPDVLLPLVSVIIAISMIFGVWYIARQVNYELTYSDFVQKTISESVKKECLK